MMENAVISREELAEHLKGMEEELVEYKKDLAKIHGSNFKFFQKSDDTEIDKAYNIENCLKDFKGVNYFKKVKNNFYNYLPANHVKDGIAVYL